MLTLRGVHLSKSITKVRQVISWFFRGRSHILPLILVLCFWSVPNIVLHLSDILLTPSLQDIFGVLPSFPHPLQFFLLELIQRVFVSGLLSLLSCSLTFFFFLPYFSQVFLVGSSPFLLFLF
ncbi:MAG: hypothetical protein ACFFAZ_11170 [Promethearchaeota archaeon]